MSLTNCIKRVCHTKELLNIQVHLIVWSWSHSRGFSFISCVVYYLMNTKLSATAKPGSIVILSRTTKYWTYAWFSVILRLLNTLTPFSCYWREGRLYSCKNITISGLCGHGLFSNMLILPLVSSHASSILSCILSCMATTSFLSSTKVKYYNRLNHSLQYYSYCNWVMASTLH